MMTTEKNTSPAIDGLRFYARAAKAAMECGIDIEKAFRFLGLLSLYAEADKGAAIEGPGKTQ